MVDLRMLMFNSVMADATDIIVTAGNPIMIRKMGNLIPSEDNRILSSIDSEEIIRGLLSEDQWIRFVNERELDLSISIPGVSRFRINCFWQRNSPGMAIRPIPFSIKSLDEIGIPQIIYELLRSPHGLILITGPTGQGKSTTLAAIIEFLNQSKMAHIITIEDPIEFLFKNKKSTIEQREVGADTVSFSNALKYVLRQNPNVVMVGELRDLETIQSALTIAETGHLVLSTLHTSTAAQTISRIIDVFPPQAKDYIGLQLSMVLRAVISQRLLKRADGTGMVLALEIMLATPAIKNMIRENTLQHINNVLQTNMDEGMITLNKSLERLMRDGIITCEEASSVSPNLPELMKLIEK